MLCVVFVSLIMNVCPFFSIVKSPAHHLIIIFILVYFSEKYISGKFCECNNFGCPRFEGLLCGGEDKGVCVCGECVCTEDFLGDNCGDKNCTKGRKLCVNDGKVCIVSVQRVFVAGSFLYFGH